MSYFQFFAVDQLADFVWVDLVGMSKCEVDLPRVVLVPFLVQLQLHDLLLDLCFVALALRVGQVDIQGVQNPSHFIIICTFARFALDKDNIQRVDKSTDLLIELNQILAEYFGYTFIIDILEGHLCILYLRDKYNKFDLMTTFPSYSQQYHKPLLRDLIYQLDQKDTSKYPSIHKQATVNPEDLRVKYKRSWRDGGYGNQEFGQLRPIRGKVLTEWQIQRMPLSRRSYTTPKNTKGYKFDSHSRPFAKNDQKTMHSQKFLKHLQKIEESFESKLFVQKPSEIKTRPETIKRLHTTNMKFTAKNDLFGTTNFWKTQKIATFKSEIFLQKKGVH